MGLYLEFLDPVNVFDILPTDNLETWNMASHADCITNMYVLGQELIE